MGKKQQSGRAEARSDLERQRFSALASSLCELGKNFYQRGWALGTSGNYSAVSSRNPLRLAITASGLDKGALTPSDIIQIDEAGRTRSGKQKPSYEYLLHLAIVRAKGAGVGAVLHTHSLWATMLSEHFAADGFLAIEGYEMLKGLEGVRTHQHREIVPILENSQDMTELSEIVAKTLRTHPEAHGFLLRRHGLYTWGQDLPQAKRHVEIFEFLLEVLGRSRE